MPDSSTQEVKAGWEVILSHSPLCSRPVSLAYMRPWAPPTPQSICHILLICNTVTQYTSFWYRPILVKKRYVINSKGCLKKQFFLLILFFLYYILFNLFIKWEIEKLFTWLTHNSIAKGHTAVFKQFFL